VVEAAVPQITQILLQPHNLDVLLDFLRGEEHVNQLLAGYFHRAVAALAAASLLPVQARALSETYLPFFLAAALDHKVAECLKDLLLVEREKQAEPQPKLKANASALLVSSLFNEELTDRTANLLEICIDIFSKPSVWSDF
jgi:hypothetical protein